MSRHITKICQSAYFHLRNIARIRKYLSSAAAQKLIHAFVSSRIDSCNSLLIGLPQQQITKLQHVHNAAAKLVTKSRKHDHVTPILRQLHWLPVMYRIRFKVLMLVFKCLHGLAPSYLKELLVPYTPPRALRSCNQFLLSDTAPKSSKVTVGDRAFSRIAPKLWNELPLHIRSSSCLVSFKTALKTHYFRHAFF